VNAAPSAPQAALIRHGAYHQHEDTPSALQPWPLTEEGKAQARAFGDELVDLIEEESLALSPVIHSSRQLRAFQTATIAARVLAAHGHETRIEQTSALAERSVGSVANLTMDEIEQVLRDDPRFEPPPPGWKADSDYRLPLDGAESMMMAGERVATYLTSAMAEKAPRTLTLFVGHGASFRHAAHLLGILGRDDIQRLSMHHARPLRICHNPDGTWAHSGGAWKIRPLKDSNPD
jgi:broad specificity phosphatase PhoE